MTKSGKNMEEKSTEKKIKFYNREDLDVKDIVDLIRIWECEAGEAFDDCCSFKVSTGKEFLEFLKTNYPVLYDYHQEVREDNWLSDTVQYINENCTDYCTEWIPEGKCNLWNDQYDLALYPLAEFILANDSAWQEFVDFFTSGDNTVSGTPYIDCYHIREDFEDGRF